jgi:hypothetical protein
MSLQITKKVIQINYIVWQNEAYGLERLMMNVTYVLDSDKFRNKDG